MPRGVSSQTLGRKGCRSGRGDSGAGPRDASRGPKWCLEDDGKERDLTSSSQPSLVSGTMDPRRAAWPARLRGVCEGCVTVCRRNNEEARRLWNESWYCRKRHESSSRRFGARVWAWSKRSCVHFGQDVCSDEDPALPNSGSETMAALAQRVRGRGRVGLALACLAIC